MKRSTHLLSLGSLLLLTTGCAKKATLESLQYEQVAPPPQTVTIQMRDYTPAAGHVFKDFIVSNFSVKAMNGTLLPVSSRDSIPDIVKTSLEAKYGFSFIGPNTANPYFSDLMLYLAGIDSTQQGRLYCADNLKNSTSNDAIIYTDDRTIPASQQFLGLRDCEKTYIGLSPDSFDFDGDGLPDYLELRCGLNPRNPNDASVSMTGDGVSNLEKCKRGIPVDESADSQPNKLFAYQYKTEVQDDGSRTFTVSNIPILDDGKDNFLAFYLTETDSGSLKTSLFTAYTILRSGSNGKTFKFSFWGSNSDPTKNHNQEISFQ